MRRSSQAMVMAAVALPGGIAAQDRGYGWGGGHPMGWMGGPWGLGMMLMMLVVAVLVVVGIVAAVRWLISDSRRPPVSDRALEILRERYARGEIDREEFEARRRDLG